MGIYKRWLPYLSEPKLQRCISLQGKIANVQLLLVTDASEMAYAAVIYARRTDVDGHIVSKLVANKTRVAPIKRVSLPRLELFAAHLGIKLLVKVNLTSPTIYGWTNSTIVLQWFSQLPRIWTSFVAKRVSEIQQTLPPVWTRQTVHQEDRWSKTCSSMASGGSVLIGYCTWHLASNIFKDRWWNAKKFSNRTKAEIQHYYSHCLSRRGTSIWH